MQYEDDERDKILLTADVDLVGAVSQARLAGWKVSSSTIIMPGCNFTVSLILH